MNDRLKKFGLIVSMFFLIQCNSLDIEKDAPACVKGRILDLEQTACDTGAEVAEYRFQGMIVYTLSAGNCHIDGGASVIDEDCNPLGFLGGIAGNQEINGVNFGEEAEFIRFIWRN